MGRGRDTNAKKPAWLRQKAPQGEMFQEVKESLTRLKLNTFCEEAQCPNIGEVSIFDCVFINPLFSKFVDIMKWVSFWCSKEGEKGNTLKCSFC